MKYIKVLVIIILILFLSELNSYAESIWVPIQMDMGPVWVRLKDTETGVMVEGTENVVNFGINWYIGGTEE